MGYISDFNEIKYIETKFDLPLIQMHCQTSISFLLHLKGLWS